MQDAVDSEMGDSGSVNAFKAALETISGECAGYVRYMNSSPPLGNTKLDRERLKLCIHEIVGLCYVKISKVV